MPGTPLSYVAEFAEWLADKLAAQDEEALVDYRSRAPHAVRAHPTDEHFIPLFIALGAAGENATVPARVRGDRTLRHSQWTPTRFEWLREARFSRAMHALASR